MALTRADHKKIAMSLSAELHKVLHDANGARVMKKHLGRVKPNVSAAADPTDEEMMALEGSPKEEEAESPAEEKLEPTDEMDREPGKKKPFPFGRKSPPFKKKA